jgi:hypothetical protein
MAAARPARSTSSSDVAPAAWDGEHGSSSSCPSALVPRISRYRHDLAGRSPWARGSAPLASSARWTTLLAVPATRHHGEPAAANAMPQVVEHRHASHPAGGTSRPTLARNVSMAPRSNSGDTRHCSSCAHDRHRRRAPRDPTRCSTPPNCSKANTANSPRHPHRRRPSNPEHDGRPPARQPSRLSVSPGRRTAWTLDFDFDGAGPPVQPHIDRRGFRRRLGHQCARCRQLTRPGHPRLAPMLGTLRTAVGARP